MAKDRAGRGDRPQLSEDERAELAPAAEGEHESFFSTLEHELLSRRQFATRDEASRAGT